MVLDGHSERGQLALTVQATCCMKEHGFGRRRTTTCYIHTSVIYTCRHIQCVYWPDQKEPVVMPALDKIILSLPSECAKSSWTWFTLVVLVLA
eukprot:46625-Eustigmatos_ZCMA.PRE.1